MLDLKLGLYEEVINNALSSSLSNLDPNEYEILKREIETSEARQILSQYVAKILERGLLLIREKGCNISNCSKSNKDSLENQITACNHIISQIALMTSDENYLHYQISPESKQLLSVIKKQIAQMENKSLHTTRPDSSLAISSLFTGSRSEPSMVNEIKREILTSDSIDLLVSFVKWSGLRLIINELREFCNNGKLRVITTTYTGATDSKAIQELSKLPNTEIKISYDTRSTRLHAKAYIFHRHTGFSTAYVGSSNLSSSAISGGLEWNVKVTKRDLPHILENIEATFNTYWNDPAFTSYDESQIEILLKALNNERPDDNSPEFMFDIEPFPFQKEILEELEAERTLHNRYRNLIVAATGTGKTVISAFDYKRFIKQNQQGENRLLFIAHREEILKQSLYCFRGVLRDNNFGELFVGTNQAEKLDHIFMSVQSLNSKRIQDIVPPDFYDFIIVDETHHGAAPSYYDLLTYFKPKILLGLTATPERMDGSDIREYFDNTIASEIRLPEAINRNLLVPFQYFCITDNVDLSTVNFDRGRYDISELSRLYISNKQRAKMIIESLERYVSDLKRVKALSFCVSKDHARFMSDVFNEYGIPSIALTDESSREDRSTAQSRLLRGEIAVIFTVDLYNEGVDIPAVNTVLFLRPTESMTIFLQQLGRGLRIFEDKEELTVLDFIGQAHKKYSFERKFQSLVESSSKSVKQQIQTGFTALPKGCYIQLEKVAKEYILNNIKNATVNKSLILERIRNYEGDSGKLINLIDFLDFYELQPEHIYSKNNTFTGFCDEAGIKAAGNKEDIKFYSQAFRKVALIDSRRWLQSIINILQRESLSFDSTEEKYILMFYYKFYSTSPIKNNFDNLEGFILSLKESYHYPELLELLQHCYRKIKFLDKKIDLGYENVLDLHCNYSREDIFCGLGINTISHKQENREGVFYYKERKTDILLINLKKTEKDFSPTTMYEDYAISETLFHWQSQSTVSEKSKTGQRYVNHKSMGVQVLLFVRADKGTGGLTSPFTYLGKANYVSHQGNNPISIVWNLEEPIHPHLLEVAKNAVRD